MLLLGLFIGGAVWVLLHPDRGLQDRLAGTYLVPRKGAVLARSRLEPESSLGC